MRTHGPSLDRRTLLATTGAGALAGLAGCLGFGNDEKPASPAAASGGDEAGRADAESNGSLTDHEYTQPAPVIDVQEQGHESTMRTVPARHELVTSEAKGGPLELPEVWAWQADDHAPSVPGPRYRVPEGETFEIHFENTEHDRSHTIHLHALAKDWKDDGVPSTTGIQVNPGESHTYTYEADVPGTHLYHCHFQTANHMDMGMYGLVRVTPDDEDPPDREYFLTLREWDSDLHHREAGADDVSYDTAERDPTLYTINGRSAPTTYHPEQGTPLIASAGERVRVHVVNAGYENHGFHTHGHRFEVVEKDGTPIPPERRTEMDVLDVAPAERYAVELTTDSDPGIYPVHCHKVDHVTNDGSYPGGMVTALVYEEVMDSPEFRSVMDAAGYEG
ncbi:multicopper oxidase domain-containing protein [Halovivax limisalsi]|uniref:multicopper oxidase domain-containing protein n=1 Tax=Halovivax limisalsi TaxID=1453760 RepID=UPI001FFDAE4F|nr:multicopper oxidase domain-containing protein [Halovivax limisalsi]